MPAFSTESSITLLSAGLAFAASLVATVTSIYNARFTRFSRERWWERKADAYSRIIDALSSLAYCYEEHLDAVMEHRDIPESRRHEIDEHWTRGYTEAKRATAAGAFLISGAAESALLAFQRDRDAARNIHPNDWFGRADAYYSAAIQCLRAVVTAAKEDLSV